MSSVAGESPIVSAPPSRGISPQRVSKRVHFAFTMVLGIGALLVLAAFFNAYLQWSGRVFLGAMVTPYMVVDGSLPVAGSWAGLDARLQRGDRLLAVNDEPLFAAPDDFAGAQAALQAQLAAADPSAPLTVTVLRQASAQTNPDPACGPLVNGLRECRFTYAPNRPGEYDTLTYFFIPFISGLAAVGIGLAVAIIRRDQGRAQWVSLFSSLLGVFLAGTFNSNNTYVLIPVWLSAALLMGGPLGVLALTFPVKAPALYRRPWLVAAPLLLALGVLALGLAQYLNPSSVYRFTENWQYGVLYTVLMLILFGGMLLRQRRLAALPSTRDQASTVLLGVLLSSVALGVWVLDTVLRSLDAQVGWLNSSAVMPFFIMPCIALAYAVLEYRRFDTDRIISQGITYLFLLVGLVLGYFLLVLGATFFTSEVVGLQANDLLVALLIFGLAVLFLPVRSFLQTRIDAIYYRQRANFQERAEAFGQQLTGLEMLDTLVQALHDELNEAIHPTSIFLFLPTSEGRAFRAQGTPPPTDLQFTLESGLLRLLNRQDLIPLDADQPWPADLVVERARLGVLRANAIVRLYASRLLLGFVVVGPPRTESGRYIHDEIRHLQNVASLFAVALERAQAVESLRRRVAELDVLTQVSQGANFTLEFNDLLELIIAQTSRLIRAPHFYIALRERGGNRMFFAFFQEADDRFEEHEGKRWQMGTDLFSEVVRKEKALRVEDYAAELAQRRASVGFERSDITAWMGVPLTVADDTLGVLATASSTAGFHFTEDQVRILEQIATLAASSLDKARLFTEANLRAQQLNALNKISQELASELNVENLLTLITREAVNILKAEAGALLLADDANQMLEFKVAIGGAGDALLGKRIPLSQGLAGEAVRTRKPAITINAPQDGRWAGEAARGEGFITQAVLAVPLLARNQVLGVLEVINRRDGSLYREEDGDLLATFAGQAAIALENARLFQSTDLQLNQRVDELQMLERIDVELNRSLDLQKVADLTLRYAINNSGATAGALGTLTAEDPPRMKIISLKGYAEDDYPAGADGLHWPLDRGIVRRVMRTRQADLATDVTIDPDYLPNRRGTLCQMTIPMLSAGEIIAILVLEKDREPRLSLVDLAFAQRLAEHASIAIANAQINAELTRANESKSEFVGFVAHELKNPIASARGFADVLIKGMAGDLSDQQRGMISTIRDNVERLNTLVTDLTDATKLELNKLVIQPEALAFGDVLEATLNPMLAQLEARSQVIVQRLPDSLPLILADRNRMIQVMTNLVSNAHKYSGANTQITIECEVRQRNLDTKGRDRGPALLVRVSDQGIGMDEEDLKKLFQPYFRSDNEETRAQPGTGLGLVITKGIIEQHGGDIIVESQRGAGTTFAFTVPLAPATPALRPLPIETVAK